jgi:2,4-dienoyl-CoA reductase-like NADH-dependent reductase (Old Yellow Enzyme family)/ribulose 1,5-bisphosphate synthetase/thiazole synthase
MIKSHSFSHLLSPGRIGSLEIRNRILMAPMGDNLGEGNGHVGERTKRYFEARARGGVGLIIVGVGGVAYPAGACIPNQVAISNDTFLPDLQDLTGRLHAHGAKVAIQLQHAGKVATQDMAAGRPMWVPSVPEIKAGDLFNDLTLEEIQGISGDLTKPGAGISFHEMTTADIHALIAMFADAADRARRAGFDAVEIHAAHGYLISSFISPASNKRNDKYGGSVENRSRLLVEVIQAIKQRVGKDFPVWCRLDAKEFRIEGGITVADAQRTAELAAKAGADAIHVSAYADPVVGVAFTDAPLVHQPCGFVDLAAGIKRRVKVPVIAVGRIEPDEADDLIREHKADFIAMGRKLLADPELPNKLAGGHAEQIRPCVYCYTCVGKIYLNQRTCCAVNPATGREAEFAITPAAKPKRVLVIGGGPAGMEAARVAALRGHKVTLCEKSGRLGGTLWFAALVYEANGRLLEYLERQVRDLPIGLRLDQEVTPALVRQLRPEVILVAVGARRQPPPIPGVERSNVLSGDDLRSLMSGTDTSVAVEKLSLAQRAMLKMGNLLGVSDRMALTRELTRHWMPLGKRVAVIGGSLVGIELAEFLSERGRDVIVLEEGSTLGTAMALPRRWRALYTLRAHGVTLLTDVHVDGITDAGVLYTKDGAQQTAPADSVILAAGVQENRGLADSLAGVGTEVRLLGDCKGVGYIEGAIMDGAHAALAI